MSTPKKRGRKPTSYRCPWNNETIDGLYCCRDGRWRITEIDQKFTEADPRLAVARFRAWQARQQRSMTLIPLSFSPVASDEEHAGAVEAVVRHELGPGDHCSAADTSLVLRVPEGSDPVELLRAVPEDAYLSRVANDILTRPKYMAEGTGIEQLGYLTNLRKPVPSPTLDQVTALYFEKKKISNNWRAKCKTFWKEFCDSVEVTELRELTQEHLVEYYDMVTDAMIDGGHRPTYARQRFGAIKSIIRFPTKRGTWTEDCNKAYAFCAVLVKPPSSRPDPQPIAPKDFETLYKSADPQMQAFLLASLNFCMYGSEAVALEWCDINLSKRTLVTDRNKTRVVRVAVLWPETVRALERLPQRPGPIFITAGTKMQQNYQTIYKAFKRLRHAVGLDHVQMSHIRDGAYTAACEGKDVQAHQAEILAGHQTGVKDRYVKRRPRIVANACAAIEREYLTRRGG